MGCRKAATRHKVRSPTGRTKRQERSTDCDSGSLCRGFGGRGRGNKGERLRGKRCKGKDCAGERAAGSGRGFGGGEVGCRRNCQLCAESEDGLVGRGRKFDPLGASGDIFAEQNVWVHGVVENSARITGAASQGRQDYARGRGEGGPTSREL